MIAVISDLHFEEEASDVIPGHSGNDLRFRRNLDAKVFASFVAHMADEVRRRRAREFHLVIAGDLFDLNRTTLWFSDRLRPYVANGELSPALERKVLRILDAIVAESPVRDAMETFRLFANGRYRTVESGKERERDFPSKVKLTILVGNHDRLINASPLIRSTVRRMLGLKGDSNPFMQYALFDDPQALIRHGHEYDPPNFALDLTHKRRIPLKVPDRGYNEPNFGDVITIDVATRLPFLLRRHYGDDKVLKDRVLRSLYLRLLQFDDVRPQSTLLDYLLDPSDENFTPEEAWERLVPVIDDLLTELHSNRFFRYWLERRARPWAPAEMEIARGLLKLGAWRNWAAREGSRRLSHFLLGGDQPEPQLFAVREELLQKNKVRLVISGHTHTPCVTLLKTDEAGDRFYINTGTWRSVIPSTPDGRMFGRMRALAYVMLFAKREQSERNGRKTNSFDYWSGFTRDW